MSPHVQTIGIFTLPFPLFLEAILFFGNVPASAVRMLVIRTFFKKDEIWRTVTRENQVIKETEKRQIRVREINCKCTLVKGLVELQAPGRTEMVSLHVLCICSQAFQPSISVCPHDVTLS
uniref:Uncharacterized protein n=1 Tax=Cacopsylla melanoneura TaxID=428564 RepID=A0A8D9BEG3_9HEMI